MLIFLFWVLISLWCSCGYHLSPALPKFKFPIQDPTHDPVQSQVHGLSRISVRNMSRLLGIEQYVRFQLGRQLMRYRDGASKYAAEIDILDVSLSPTAFVSGSETGSGTGLSKNALLASQYLLKIRFKLRIIGKPNGEIIYESENSRSDWVSGITLARDSEGAVRNTVLNKLNYHSIADHIAEQIAFEIFHAISDHD